MECEDENVRNGRRRLKIRIGDVFGGINFLFGVWRKRKVFYHNFGDEGLSFLPQIRWMCV